MNRRNIVVTGATRGLGRALADRFVRGGHTVAGCGRNADAIGDLAAAYTAPHHFSTVDVASPGEVDSWAATLEAGGFVPDLLVNNAGVINRNAPLWEVSPGEFERVMAVNVIGCQNAIRAFVPRMIRRGQGVIVNVSSGWGRSTAPEVGPYCASKWAVEGLTRSLAQELPRPLCAVSLNPGVIDTAMLRTCWNDEAAMYRKPEEWSEQAARTILSIGPRDNGAALSV